MKDGVIKRGKRWSAVFEAKDPTTGARRRKWVSLKGCTTREEAKLARAAILVDRAAGAYVEPRKLTVGDWINQWLEAGAPGRRRKKVSQRSLERYGQLLRTHVVPALGSQLLQQLQATAIDRLYRALEGSKIAPRTAHHVHVVFGACLATAHRKGLIATNPMVRVEQVPNPEALTTEEHETDDIGEGLSETDLKALVAGFETSNIYAVVVLAAATGMRRNELLALRWSDFDLDKRTLRVERALEQTKAFGIRFKPPKTKRGLRTIGLDHDVIAVLLKQRERQLRLVAGVADGVEVDLSLVRLPPGALMFPAIFGSLTTPRNPHSFSNDFAQRAEELGFGRVRFHDLRGIHSTALLDAGIPVHTVAQRIGDDPATLLRSYTKRQRLKQADEKLASAIAALTAGFLGR